jgi:hypothetical protein
MSFGPDPRDPGAEFVQRGIAGFDWMEFVRIIGVWVGDGVAEGLKAGAGGCVGEGTGNGPSALREGRSSARVAMRGRERFISKRGSLVRGFGFPQADQRSVMG